MKMNICKDICCFYIFDIQMLVVYKSICAKRKIIWRRLKNRLAENGISFSAKRFLHVTSLPGQAFVHVKVSRDEEEVCSKPSRRVAVTNSRIS